MDLKTDHYHVLGLPSGEEGTRSSDKDIVKAYKRKALSLHPDKRPLDDPQIARAEFQKLQLSYEFLMDQTKRKIYDSFILRRENSQSRRFKRKKMDPFMEANRVGKHWERKAEKVVQEDKERKSREEKKRSRSSSFCEVDEEFQQVIAKMMADATIAKNKMFFADLSGWRHVRMPI